MIRPRSDTDIEADERLVKASHPGAMLIRYAGRVHPWCVMDGFRTLGRGYNSTEAWKQAAYHVARSSART